MSSSARLGSLAADRLAAAVAAVSGTKVKQSVMLRVTSTRSHTCHFFWVACSNTDAGSFFWNVSAATYPILVGG